MTTHVDFKLFFLAWLSIGNMCFLLGNTFFILIAQIDLILAQNDCGRFQESPVRGSVVESPLQPRAGLSQGMVLDFHRECRAFQLSGAQDTHGAGLIGTSLGALPDSDSIWTK